MVCSAAYVRWSGEWASTSLPVFGRIMDNWIQRKSSVVLATFECSRTSQHPTMPYTAHLYGSVAFWICRLYCILICDSNLALIGWSGFLSFSSSTCLKSSWPDLRKTKNVSIPNQIEWSRSNQPGVFHASNGRLNVAAAQRIIDHRPNGPSIDMPWIQADDVSALIEFQSNVRTDQFVFARDATTLSSP